MASPWKRDESLGAWLRMWAVLIAGLIVFTGVVFLFADSSVRQSRKEAEDEAGPARARPGYAFGALNVTAEVRADGSLAVSERRTIAIAGAVPAIVWTWGVEDRQAVAIERVYSGIGTFRYDGWGSSRSGTYQVSRDSGRIIVKLVTSMAGTTRRFETTYTVSGAARRYADTAELVWRFVGDGADHGVGFATIDVAVPTGVPDDAVVAWTDGPADASVTTVGRRVLVAVENLPADTAVEVRALFPASALAAAPGIATPRLDAALAEREQRLRDVAATLAESAARDRDERRAATLVTALAALLGVVFLVVMVRLRGRGYRWSWRANPEMTIPSDLPPAVVAYLWDAESVPTNGLNATLLDLVDDRVLRLEASGAAGDDGRPDDPVLTLDRSRLARRAPFERELMRVVFDFVVQGDSVTMGRLREHAARFPEELARGLTDFAAVVITRARDEGLVDRHRPAAAWAVRIAGTTVVVVSAAAGALSDQPWLFAGGAVGAVMIALAGRLMRRPSSRGVELFHRYRDLRRYMLAAGGMAERPPEAIAVWGEYLVLAEALGVADHVSRSLRLSEVEVAADLLAERVVAVRDSLWATAPPVARGTAAARPEATGSR